MQIGPLAKSLRLKKNQAIFSCGMFRWNITFAAINHIVKEQKKKQRYMEPNKTHSSV